MWVFLRVVLLHYNEVKTQIASNYTILSQLFRLQGKEKTQMQSKQCISIQA